MSGLTALLCAGLVGVLSLLAVSPSAHALLHAGGGEAVPVAGRTADCDHAGCAGGDRESSRPADSSPADDAGCVVTLFTHGVPVVFDLPTLPAAARVVEAVLGRAGEVQLTVAGRHLHPLAHAPPVA